MDDRAKTVAETLVEADLMGHDIQHGPGLLRGYVDALLGGTMQGIGEPDVVRDHGLWRTGIAAG